MGWEYGGRGPESQRQACLAVTLAGRQQSGMYEFQRSCRCGQTELAHRLDQDDRRFCRPVNDELSTQEEEPHPS